MPSAPFFADATGGSTSTGGLAAAAANNTVNPLLSGGGVLPLPFFAADACFLVGAVFFTAVAAFLADFRDARAGPRARTAGASMWTEPLGGRWLPETVRAGARALVINLRFQQIFFPKKFFFYEFSPFEQEGTWKVCVEAGWVEDAAVRGCRGARPACAGRPAPWRRAECAALNRSLWIPGAPCNKVLQWRPVTGACRRGARGGSGNRQAGVGAWHPGRTPHARRAGCSIAAPAHLESLGAPGVQARLCWSIACAAPAPRGPARAGELLVEAPRCRLVPRVWFVSACSSFRKFSRTEWLLTVHIVLCVCRNE